MSDTTDELAAIDAAARDLLPDLASRLERHGLGEIEVRRGDLRLRISRSAAEATVHVSGMAPEAHPGQRGRSADAAGHGSGHPSTAHGVTSPAVGYFVFGDGLGPGLEVGKGDPLGYVDVLGVRHDVRAPRSGVVRNLVTETGEAVEYGQLLIELEAPAS